MDYSLGVLKYKQLELIEKLNKTTQDRKDLNNLKITIRFLTVLNEEINELSRLSD